MPSYETIDAISDLTQSEISLATKIAFKKTSVGYDTWDSLFSYFSESMFYESELLKLFSWEGVKGRTYAFGVTSYKEPTMAIYDTYGNAINAVSDSNIPISKENYLTQSITHFIAPYTGTYYAEALWHTNVFYNQVIFFGFEDVDTEKAISANSPPTGEVTIKGILTQGQKLSVFNSLADTDGLGTINYQWLQDGKIISGANKTTYDLTASDVGKSISVQASYIDKLQHSESVTSSPTSAVIAVASIKPTSGNDQLTGTVKNDTLSSLTGDDTLIGGLGVDILTGGLGTDVFKFNQIKETGLTVKTRDTITDFKTTDGDKIDLSGIDANTNRTGDQAFTQLDVGAKFSGKFMSTGQLFFDTTTHILWGNVDTKAGADFSIQLSGVTSLVAADFIL